jgi:hypothetical protein
VTLFNKRQEINIAESTEWYEVQQDIIVSKDIFYAGTEFHNGQEVYRGKQTHRRVGSRFFKEHELHLKLIKFQGNE